MNGWDWLAENYWIWGLIAFLLGALITWVLLVRRFAVRTANAKRGDAHIRKPDTDLDADVDLPGTGTVAAAGRGTAGVGVGMAAGRHADDEVDWSKQVESDVAEPEPAVEPEPIEEPAGAAEPMEEPATFEASPEDASQPEIVTAEPEPATASEPEAFVSELEPDPEPTAGAAGVAGGIAAGTATGAAGGPHGAGSAEPLADGSAPGAEYAIKGNADSMLFHTEDSPYYGRTKAEVWFDTESNARAAGFARWDERDKVEAVGIASVPEGPYGAGSAEPLADGGAPSEAFTVKGNADSMLFHTEDSPYYGRTKAEVWFDTESSARAAGFTKWDER